MCICSLEVLVLVMDYILQILGAEAVSLMSQCVQSLVNRVCANATSSICASLSSESLMD